MSSRQERVVTNISRVSGTDGKQLYTAVIGGLESYRKYRVEVLAVTQFGVWSCRQEPLTVRTGEHNVVILKYPEFLLGAFYFHKGHFE